MLENFRANVLTSVMEITSPSEWPLSPVFVSLGIVLLYFPLDGILVHPSSSPQLPSGTHLYTRNRKALCEYRTEQYPGQRNWDISALINPAYSALL